MKPKIIFLTIAIAVLVSGCASKKYYPIGNDQFPLEHAIAECKQPAPSSEPSASPLGSGLRDLAIVLQQRGKFDACMYRRGWRVVRD